VKPAEAGSASSLQHCQVVTSAHTKFQMLWSTHC